MRSAVLDSLSTLLLARRWSAITMTDVAEAAGVSRATLYNEFRSRNGLARSYAIRLTDTIATGVEDAVYSHPDDSYRAIWTGYAGFFAKISTDPLVQSLRTEDPPTDLLKMITVEADFIMDHAVERLAEAFRRSWVQAQPADAELMGKAIVRTALSFISLPAPNGEKAAEDVARFYVPFVEAIRSK